MKTVASLLSSELIGQDSNPRHRLAEPPGLRCSMPSHTVIAMKIVRFETLLANAGLRNYLFIRLTTDTGLTGVGEATLEWQECVPVGLDRGFTIGGVHDALCAITENLLQADCVRRTILSSVSLKFLTQVEHEQPIELLGRCSAIPGLGRPAPRRWPVCWQPVFPAAVDRPPAVRRGVGNRSRWRRASHAGFSRSGIVADIHVGAILRAGRGRLDGGGLFCREAVLDVFPPLATR